MDVDWLHSRSSDRLANHDSAEIRRREVLEDSSEAPYRGPAGTENESLGIFTHGSWLPFGWSVAERSDIRRNNQLRSRRRLHGVNGCVGGDLAHHEALRRDVDDGQVHDD